MDVPRFLRPCLAVLAVSSTLLVSCEPLPPGEEPAAPTLEEAGQGLTNDADITEYAAKCRAALGNLKVNTFNCRDGDLIPITNTADGATCDKPIWLTLDTGKQCYDNARLLRLESTKADTEVRVICRRYEKGASTVNDFQDVAIVMANSTSGETCYFQALKGNFGAQLDGSKVPNPLADPASADAAEKAAGTFAKKFFIAPSVMKSQTGLHCSKCHDSDPWMHTPYIDQVTSANAVPTEFVDVKYKLVEEAYLTGGTSPWPKPKAVTTAKVKDDNGDTKRQVCTSCHRIGRANTCGKWVDWAVDAKLVPQTNADAQKYPAKSWMPPNKPAMEADYHKKYDKHVKVLKCCCTKPWALGCERFDDLGTPSTSIKGTGAETGAGTDKCVFGAGEVALGVSISPIVVAARSPSDTSCTAPLTTPVCADFSIQRLQEDGTTTTLTVGPNGNPLRACGNHWMSPYPGPHESTIQVEAGDLVTITAPQTYAFGAGHEPLVFAGWNTSPSCPCTGGSSTCQFRTKGASDWFSDEFTSNPYNGDPPSFQCQALYVQSGVCRTPDAGVDAGVDAGFDAGVDAGVDAGFDAGTDAGRDAGADAGFDAGTDAGADAGVCDGGLCGPADAGVSICDGGVVTQPLPDGGRLVSACQVVQPAPL